MSEAYPTTGPLRCYRMLQLGARAPCDQRVQFLSWCQVTASWPLVMVALPLDLVSRSLSLILAIGL
eukprot:2694890-Prymnesium_polylepis.2